MRNQRLLLPAGLLLLCLGWTNEAVSQKAPRDKYRSRATKDTLVIQLGVNDRVAIPVRSVRQFEVDSVNALVRQLNRDLGVALDSLGSSGAPVTILYQETTDGGRRLQVNTKANERSELYFVRETGLIKGKTTPDSVIVERANQQKLFFVLDRIAGLKQLEGRDLDSLVGELRQAIAIDGQLNGMRDASIPFGGWLKVTYLDAANRKPGEMRKVSVDYFEDFGLGILLGMGVGLVRDKVVPEIGTGIAYRFPRTTAYVGLKFTFHYFFDRRTDGSYQMNINTFMSAELGDKFKSGNGLSIGYLIHRSGGYFKGTTFKLSQSVRTEKIGRFRLVPELIVTNGFRTVFPGIRIGVGF
ncbi:MAG: hypothetical protein H7Z75_07130 [Ferruginibacter sp.]|nr:hypothetical protein [Cytophagales bacterium]